jgi:hypothetical protein
MPFLDIESVALEKAIGDSPLDSPPEQTDFAEERRAAYRLENTVGSYFARDGQLPDSRVTNPEFTPVAYMSADEKMDPMFVDRAILADNEDEVEAVRRQYTREKADRATLAKGGLAATLLAGVADPINYIPVGGVAYKTYRGGSSILTSAAATSASAMGSAGIAEAALQHTQLTRTYGESAVNIAASGFLGGILGAAPVAVRDMLQRANLEEKVVLREIDEVMNPEPTVAAGLNSTAPMGDRAMGAAQVMDDPVVRGKLARAVTKFIGFDPLSRTITSENKLTRTTSARLAENPIGMEGGQARTAVESKIKTYDGFYFKAITKHKAIFKDYRVAGGSLNNKDFKEATSRAMRNPTNIPEVQAAADAWRAELYEPIKKRAIEAKLLPEDVDVSTAESYLNRVWNKHKVASQMPLFVERVAGWLDSQNNKKAELKDPIVEAHGQFRTQQTAVVKLDRQKVTAERQLAQASKQLEEIQRENKASLTRSFSTKDSVNQKLARIGASDLSAKSTPKTADDAAMQEYEAFLDSQHSATAADTIKESEKIIKDALKGEDTVGQFFAMSGGINRSLIEAEGVDPASFKDRGKVFGKPLYRVNGGKSADELAEALNEINYKGGKLTANDVVDMIHDIANGTDPLMNGDVIAKVAFYQKIIDDLSSAPDASRLDIEGDIKFEAEMAARRSEAGNFDQAPAPAPKAVPELKGLKGQRREISVAANRQRARSNTLHDRIQGLNAKIQTIDADLLARNDATIKLLDDLEGLTEEWPSNIGKKIKAAIEGRDGKQLTKLSKDLKTSIAKISKVDLDDIDTRYLASEIAGRIMSTPDGRLPYDYQLGDKIQGRQVSERGDLAGPFQKRSFNIPDDMVEEFLENDIEELGALYIRGTAPDIELTKEFGDITLENEIKAIEQMYTNDLIGAKTPKDVERIDKARDRDIESLAAMRDRIRGVYNMPDSNNPWVRAARTARDLNYMRLLGGVVASSLPDVARIVSAEGIVNTFRHGLAPLATNLNGFKVSAIEGKEYSIGIDALIGGRGEILADIGDHAQGGTAFERGVRSAANKFSSVNLMNQWTAGIKQLHFVVAQTRITKDLLAGNYDPRLMGLGIDEHNATAIAEQLRAHSRNIDGVLIANTGKWSNPDLAEMWRAGLTKESDRVIIVPGQERPLFMSSEVGKTVLQFKTFMFSATQRMTISTLQAQDKHFIQGALGLVSIGAMAYAFKQWDAGREISTDPMTLVTEGIDRSGMLGIFMEMNNTVEKISSNTLGMRPMLGVSAPASRYASRSVLESAVGPTFGLLGDVVKTTNALTSEHGWAESDTRALRRLIPGQNLSIFRQGLDVIEGEVNSAFGIN